MSNALPTNAFSPHAASEFDAADIDRLDEELFGDWEDEVKHFLDCCGADADVDFNFTGADSRHDPRTIRQPVRRCPVIPCKPPGTRLLCVCLYVHSTYTRHSF